MKLLTNLATFGVMSLPIWIVVFSLTRSEVGSLTVRLAEPDVTVVIGDKTYKPDSLQLGPLALEPGTYNVRVLRADRVLYRETILLASGIDRVINAFWDPADTVPVVTTPMREFSTGPTSIASVAFSPDGRLALSAGNDRMVRIWDVQTGSEQRWLEGHLLDVTQAVFSPDGRRVLSCSKDGSVRVWDVATGRELRRFSVGRQLHSVAISAEGRSLVAGGDDQSLHCWDAETAAERGSFRVEPMAVGSVALAGNGGQILAGYLGAPEEVNPVCLVDSESGRLIRRFEGHKLAVWSVALSPDGRFALSGSSDRSVHLWSIADGGELRRFDAGEGAALCVAFSPDGQLVLAGTGPRWRDGWQAAGRYRVRVWETATGRLLRDYQHEEPVRSLAVAPDGRSFLSGGDDGVMRLWTLKPGGSRASVQPAATRHPDPASELIQPLPMPATAQF